MWSPNAHPPPRPAEKTGVNIEEEARREARVQAAWAEWRNAVADLEAFRRLGMTPEYTPARVVKLPPPLPRLTGAKPVSQDTKPAGHSGLSGKTRVRTVHHLPEGWQVGIPCGRPSCENNLQYPREYKQFCSSTCYKKYMRSWSDHNREKFDTSDTISSDGSTPDAQDQGRRSA